MAILKDIKRLLLGTAITASTFSIVLSSSKNASSVDAYNSNSIRNVTTIDLNDCSASEIKSYYSSLTSKSTSEKQGENLLKNLKTILKTNQIYYKYDGGSLWDLYEISDRDWEKSPATTTATNYSYNPVTKIITNYKYDTVNPYVHSLYTNRNVDNQAKAQGDHTQTNWGINQEHIWPKSQGFNASGAGGARGDPMHLWAGNGRVNGAYHNNYHYGYVDLNKTYKDAGNDYSYLSNNYLGVSLTTGLTGDANAVFEPQDSDKGDIARAIFYMVARYNYLAKDGDTIDQNNPNLELKQSPTHLASYTSTASSTGYMGLMSDLLHWNHIDPPDEYEIHRNNLLYKNYTNNRNPFIDYPEWADYIWGTVDYNGRNFQSYNAAPSGSVDLSTDVINGFKNAKGVTLSKNSISVNVNKTAKISATSTNGANISWSSSNNSIASVSPLVSESGSEVIISGVAVGETTITASATIDGQTYSATCSVSVTQAQSENTATKVTSINDLNIDDEYIIAASNYDVALSTTQNSNNRAEASITKNGDNIIYNDQVQIFTLKEGNIAGTYSLYDDPDGYIYAASSSKNYLRTQSTLDDNGSWAITFSSGNASIIAQGTNSINILRYNNSSKLFSCYSSGQENVSLYKVNSGPISVTGVSLNKQTTEIANGTSEQLIASVSPSKASDKAVTWSTSNPFVVDVDENGLITAKSEGTAFVTVTTHDGGFTDTCEVNVIEDEIDSISVDEQSSKLNYYVDEQFDKNKIVVKLNYKHADQVILDNSNLTFSLSNEEFKVSDVETGKDLTITYRKDNVDYSTTVNLSVSRKQGAVYSLSGTSHVSFSNVPEGSSVNYSSTSGIQLTANNSMTVTLQGYEGNKITGISLLMKSNTSSGSGYISADANFTKLASIGDSENPLAFNDDEFNGCYSTSYQYLDLPLESEYIVYSGTAITISLFATQNSLYCKGVNINYVSSEGPDLESITLSGNSKSFFYVNDEFTHNGMVVTANYVDGTSEDVTSYATWSNPDMTTTGSKNVVVTYFNKYAQYRIIVDNPQVYQKVVEEPESWEGTYLLVYEIPASSSQTEITSGYAWTGVDAGKCHADVSISENVISTKPDNAVTLTIEEMDGGYSIRVNSGINDEKYIGGKSTSNTILFSTNEILNTLSFSNGSVKITSDTSQIMYNSTSGKDNERFRYYKSESQQKEVQLYKFTGQPNPDLNEAQNYALKLHSCLVCYYGAQEPTILNTTWTNLENEFNALSEAAKSFLVTATYTLEGSKVTPTEGTTKRVALGVSKYDQVVHSYSYKYHNFMHRDVSYNSKYSIYKTLEMKEYLIPTIFAFLCASSIGIYTIYKRRKLY